jgi:hypothetical protein
MCRSIRAVKGYGSSAAVMMQVRTHAARAGCDVSSVSSGSDPLDSGGAVSLDLGPVAADVHAAPPAPARLTGVDENPAAIDAIAFPHAQEVARRRQQFGRAAGNRPEHRVKFFLKGEGEFVGGSTSDDREMAARAAQFSVEAKQGARITGRSVPPQQSMQIGAQVDRPLMHCCGLQRKVLSQPTHDFLVARRAASNVDSPLRKRLVVGDVIDSLVAVPGIERIDEVQAQSASKHWKAVEAEASCTRIDIAHAPECIARSDD